MSRPGLLRRATPATLRPPPPGGPPPRPPRPTAWTGAIKLGLARRASAAVIGIRSYRPDAETSPRARAWEVRQPARTTPRPALTALSSTRAQTSPRAAAPPTLYDDDPADPSAWLTVV